MQNQTIEVLNLLIITTIIIFCSILFVFFIIFKLKKKQLAIKTTFDIMQLNHANNLLNLKNEIQENTFKEVSREIHDNISLGLTLAKLNLNTVENNSDKDTAKKISIAVDLISKSLVDLNNLSKSLDGDVIERFGLIYALEKEIENINIIGNIKVKLSISGVDKYLESNKELAIFRIIQESIKNVIKHAKATKVEISITYLIHEIIVEFIDNGIGFDISNMSEDKNRSHSSGLKNMNNRAKMAGAYFSIESSLGIGTKIRLELPI